MGRYWLAGRSTVAALTLVRLRQARQKPTAAAIQIATLIQNSVVISGIRLRLPE